MNQQQKPTKDTEVANEPMEQNLYQPETAIHPQAFSGYELFKKEALQQPTQSVEAISWEASEYIHHAKGLGWLVALIFVTALLVGLALWLQIWTFAIVIVVMAAAIGFLAFRPPRVLHYKLDEQGLRVEDHLYGFVEFRSFGILSEGAFYTIVLIPAKRFMPAINVFFAEQDGEKIVDILGSRLPMEALQLDIVDRIMRQLRF